MTGPELVVVSRRLLAGWRDLTVALRDLTGRRDLVTGPDLIAAWRSAFPEDVADVPVAAIRGLESMADSALLAARAVGNTPRRRIAEDGKRGGKETPKR